MHFLDVYKSPFVLVAGESDHFFLLKSDYAVSERIKSVIFASSNIDTGVKLGAALADDNITGNHAGATKNLDA